MIVSRLIEKRSRTVKKKKALVTLSVRNLVAATSLAAKPRYVKMPRYCVDH